MGRSSARKHKRRAFLLTREVRVRTCPGCQAALDGATGISLDEPAGDFSDMPEGSVTACVYCGAILVVEGDHFRPVTPEEFASLDPDAQRLLGEAAVMKRRMQ